MRCIVRLAGITVAGALLGAAAAASAQVPSVLFDDRHIHEIYLDVAPADWDTLRRDYLLNTYYEADFTWKEHRLERVGIRSRGSGSRSPEKPNLLVSFSRYNREQRLLGLDAVVLKANNQDPSLLHELITMNLFRHMGLPAPREAPVRLYVNGRFFGAYTLVERIDAAFLRRNFGEDTGYLYEWQAVLDDHGYRFEYLGPDPAAYSPGMWSPSNNESNPDPAPLEAMVRAINLAPDSDFVRSVSEFIDFPHFLAYIATENFSADFDGLLGTVYGMNNFYFYRFRGMRLSHFLAWDKDNSFDWEYKPIFEGVPDNVLARRTMGFPSLRNGYLDALVRASAFAGGPDGWMAREIERLYRLIRDTAREDPHKQCVHEGVMYTCGGREFEDAVEKMRRFARLRADFVTREAVASGYRPPEDAPLIGAAVDAFTSELEVAPGGLISIYGRRLAGSTREAIDERPRTLDEVVVLIDGVRVPILYVSPNQINAQVPADLRSGPAGVNVRVGGRSSNTTVVYVQEPGLSPH